MAHADHLIGLTLAAVWGAHDLDGIVIPDHLKIAPEGGRDATVIGVFDHGRELAVLDQLTPLTAKLEFIARVVDGPRAVGLHIDTTFYRGKHLCQTGVARLQVEIGHAIDGGAVPATGAGVGDSWEVGTDLRGEPAEGPLQDTMADEVLALRWLAIIVKALTDILLRPGGVEGDIE